MMREVSQLIELEEKGLKWLNKEILLEQYETNRRKITKTWRDRMTYCVSSPYQFKIENKTVYIKNLKTGYWQKTDLIV